MGKAKKKFKIVEAGKEFVNSITAFDPTAPTHYAAYLKFAGVVERVLTKKKHRKEIPLDHTHL